MAHIPRQTIIEFLSAPVAASHNPLVVAGDEMTQRGTQRTSGGLGAVASTIQFLKEREVEHFYACIVTFEDVKGQEWEMVCMAQENEQGNWVLRNGSGGAPHASKPKEGDVQTTRAEIIGGPGTEGGFFAGGCIIGPDAQISTHAKLIDQDGTTLEDVVNAEDDGRVLFVTGQDLKMPVRVVTFINASSIFSGNST